MRIMPRFQPGAVAARPLTSPSPTRPRAAALGRDRLTLAAVAAPAPGIKQRLEHLVAHAVVALSEIPLLERAGYYLYGAATRPKSDPAEVNNLATVAPTVLRGGQPTQAGLATLKAQGVGTVINLRPEARWEEPLVKAQGMKYLYMPLPAVGAPTFDQLTAVLSAVTDPANGKVFFHCQHGADRTGAVAAAYRIAAQGWTVDAALKEMYGLGFHAGFEDAKLDSVRDFARQWATLPAAKQQQILHQTPLRPKPPVL